MAMTEYIEYFGGGVMLTYTSEAPMTDEQRTQFMALMPIVYADTANYTKSKTLNSIFGEGKWECTTPPPKLEGWARLLPETSVRWQQFDIHGNLVIDE